MLYLGKKNFVNVFDVEVKEKYVQAHISSSEKVNENEYANSNWYGRFVGQAFDKAKSLNQGQRICIVKGVVKNKYVKEKSRAYTSVTIFDFEIVNKNEKGEVE